MSACLELWVMMKLSCWNSPWVDSKIWKKNCFCLGMITFFKAILESALYNRCYCHVTVSNVWFWNSIKHVMFLHLKHVYNVTHRCNETHLSQSYFQHKWKKLAIRCEPPQHPPVSSLPVVGLDKICSVNTHVGEEVRVCRDDFAGHAGFGWIYNAIFAQVIDIYCKVLLDVLACLPAIGNILTASVLEQQEFQTSKVRAGFDYLQVAKTAILPLGY